jgi:hypothetical protein
VFDLGPSRLTLEKCLHVYLALVVGRSGRGNQLATKKSEYNIQARTDIQTCRPSEDLDLALYTMLRTYITSLVVKSWALPMKRR